MSLDPKVVTMIAKKDYTDFAKEINKEVESRMKTHLTGFTNYLEKTTFRKED